MDDRMSQTEQQYHVDCVHAELINVFSSLMEVTVNDEESRRARKSAVDACMRAKRKLAEAGLDHSVVYQEGIIDAKSKPTVHAGRPGTPGTDQPGQ